MEPAGVRACSSGKYLDGIPEGSRAALPGYEWLRERAHRTRSATRASASSPPIADDLDCTLSQLAIAWCAANPNVSTVITGASRVEQVHENMGAMAVVARLDPRRPRRDPQHAALTSVGRPPGATENGRRFTSGALVRSWPMRGRRLVLTFGLLTALFAAGYGVMFTMLDDFRDEFGIGPLRSARSCHRFFSSFLAQVLLAPLADRGHARRLVYLGMLLNVVGLVGMALGTTFLTLVLARLVMGIGAGMAQPAIRRIVILSAPDDLGATSACCCRPRSSGSPWARPWPPSSPARSASRRRSS